VGANHTLFAVSAGIGNLIAGGELDEEYAQARLIRKGIDVLGPARRSEVERTVRQGIARGKKTPKTAPTDSRALASAM
jgi:hypothetical protein